MNLFEKCLKEIEDTVERILNEADVTWKGNYRAEFTTRNGLEYYVAFKQTNSNLIDVSFDFLGHETTSDRYDRKDAQGAELEAMKTVSKAVEEFFHKYKDVYSGFYVTYHTRELIKRRDKEIPLVNIRKRMYGNMLDSFKKKYGGDIEDTGSSYKYFFPREPNERDVDVVGHLNKIIKKFRNDVDYMYDILDNSEEIEADGITFEFEEVANIGIIGYEHFGSDVFSNSFKFGINDENIKYMDASEFSSTLNKDLNYILKRGLE